MRYSLVAIWMLAVPGVAHAAETAETKAVSVGPWQVEASFTDARKFDRCVMTRPASGGVDAAFTRNDAGLSLTLTSSKWQLEKGVTYPVELTAGHVSWKTDVTAASDNVRLALTDQNFNDALKRANALDIRTARSTITVALNRSAAALERLEKCYETNNTAAETNPFTAPKP